jgi:hypothetical protein
MGVTERSAVFGFCPSNLPIIDKPSPTSNPPDANGWRSRYLSSGNYTTSLPVKRFVQSTTGGGVLSSTADGGTISPISLGG